jgi:outer membrane protein assembly factor BamB
MAQTLRLHLFLPANDNGVIPPTSRDDLDEFGLFNDYFPSSSYASLRDEQRDLVSQIFEEREDNLQKIDELERELRDLYPEADLLRVRDNSDLYDQEGPEWEYDSNIIIQVANFGIDSPHIRWQYGDDLFGKQLTPPSAVAGGHIALTDGRNLWGVNTESGEVTWSFTIPGSTSRSPTLVGQTVIVEAKDEHIAYNIESGEKRWTVDDLPVRLTTRHITLNEHCYFGDHEGTVWELSSTGDYRAICDLGERIIEVCPTEEQVYALMRGEGQSGIVPETLHAVDRISGDEHWVFSPEKTLNSEVAAGSEFVFVSTREKIVALHSETGDIAWIKSPTESSDEEADTDTGNKDSDNNDTGNNTSDEPVGTSLIDWKNKDRYQSMFFTARPVLDDALFAPTNEGLLRIDPSTGDVAWKALTGDDERKRGSSNQPLGPFSPPSHDQGRLYLAAGDSVYAINKKDGETRWEFETPGNPGTMTFDPDTDSLTFVTRGLAINADADEKNRLQ